MNASPADMRYRVVVVGEDAGVRALARRHLERSAHFRVVAEAHTAEEGVETAARHQPEATLLDLRTLDGQALTTLPRIRAVAPDCAVVVLADPQAPREDALAVGASGWLPKPAAWEEVPMELLRVLREQHVLPRRESRCELPAALTSGRQARSFLRATLRRWGAGHLLHDAELLTSEVINNAVVHARSAVTVRVRLENDRLRVEVVDNGKGTLHRQHSGLHDTGGRGLELVDAFSSSWGTTADGDDRVVWFELDGNCSTR